jgi:hypothetical protein
MRTIWVHCHKSGTLLRSYDYGKPEALNDAAHKPPTRESLEDAAKNDLTNEGLAAPPYTGITFKIEFPR